jgi:hypothetical protein
VSRLRTGGLVLLVVAGATGAVLLVNRRGNLGLPFMYDEMWRADLIRSGHPLTLLLAHDTPVPPGWLALLHLVTSVLPPWPAVYRLVALAPLPAAAAVSAIVLRRSLGDAPPALWAGPPLLLCALPALTGVYYFTNYPFEILYLTVLALAAVSLDRSPRWLAALAAGVALAPLFVVGGLLAVPGFVAWGAWRARRSPRRLLVVGAGAATGALLSAAVYVALYRPMTAKPTIAAWWLDAGTTFGGAATPAGLALRLLTQVRDGLVPDRLPVSGGWVAAVAGAAVLASAVAGGDLIGRRQPWLLAVPLSAQLLTVPAALAAHWPVTLERVNLCFQWFLLLTVAAGFLRLVTWPVRDRPALGLATVVVLAALAAPRSMRNDPHDFARGLPADLAVVAASPAPHNVVIGYHWMSWPYLDDALVNDAPAHRTFDIVRDQPGDRAISGPVDRIAAERAMAPGDRLWCVKPIQLGETFEDACRTEPGSRLHVVARQVSDDSTIMAFELG